MLIGLINPKGTLFSNNIKLSNFLEASVAMGSFRHFWSAPNLGLLTIASYLPETYSVEYIDENYREIDFNKKYDMVCISAMTVQAVRAYEIIRLFKERKVLTVIGGIHATILYHEAAMYADVVLVGEGEWLFPRFLDDYINHQDYKRIYMDQSTDTYDLENCITPRYELLKGYDYPIINVYTTRGCPRKCDFCCASNVYGLKYRRKTNRQIISEIEKVEELYPDRTILFADDNLFVMRRHNKELLEKLVSRNIRWIAQTDITIAEDDELLELMYLSGCQWIVIGFESININSLKNIEQICFKSEYVNEYHKKIAKIKSHGVMVYGTFIVGLDHDTYNVFNDTADFILKNNLYGANITVPTPLPGTKLRKELLNAKRILNNNWSDYTLWDVVIEPAQMSREELEEGLLYIYQKISSSDNADQRLRNILSGMRNINSVKTQ